MGVIEGFGSDGKTWVPKHPFVPLGAGPAFGFRSHAAITHNEHLNAMGKLTTADINKQKLPFLVRRHIVLHDVTNTELEAARSAFVDRMPYLAPENRKIPSGTSVDSLLAGKRVTGDRVHYGQVSLSAKDAVDFEKLQRELSAIDATIATRQLYQVTHGKMPTRILLCPFLRMICRPETN